jgi:hypothetical protein
MLIVRRTFVVQGWEVVRAEHLQQLWKEKYDEWVKRPKSKSKRPSCGQKGAAI